MSDWNNLNLSFVIGLLIGFLLALMAGAFALGVKLGIEEARRIRLIKSKESEGKAE